MNDKDPFREFVEWQRQLPNLPHSASASEVQFYLAELAKTATSTTMVCVTTLKQSADAMSRNMEVLSQVQAQLVQNSAAFQAVLDKLNAQDTIKAAPTSWPHELREALTALLQAIPPMAWTILAVALLAFVVGKLGLSLTDGEHTIQPHMPQPAPLILPNIEEPLDTDSFLPSRPEWPQRRTS